MNCPHAHCVRCPPRGAQCPTGGRAGTDGSLDPGHQSHDGAAGFARPFRLRHRSGRAHLAVLARVAVAPPEATILSTCNRTEIYCAGEHSDAERTLEWLAQSGGVSPALLRSHAYTLHDGLAARHAFRVASGLDSMVLGEPQILGQMKDAVRVADQAGALGTTLQPAVPAILRRRQGGPQLHRDRRPLHQHGRRGGPPRQPAVRRPGRHPRAVRRRGRNDRACGNAFRRSQRPSASPSPTARWNAAKSWPRVSAARR